MKTKRETLLLVGPLDDLESHVNRLYHENQDGYFVICGDNLKQFPRKNPLTFLKLHREDWRNMMIETFKSVGVSVQLDDSGSLMDPNISNEEVHSVCELFAGTIMKLFSHCFGRTMDSQPLSLLDKCSKYPLFVEDRWGGSTTGCHYKGKYVLSRESGDEGFPSDSEIHDYLAQSRHSFVNFNL